MTTLPPSLQSLPPSLELRVGERIVGWITGDVVRFHGFHSRQQAAQAAAVAHRRMMRRIARGRGRKHSTTEADLGAIRRSTDRANAAIDSRPVASVLPSQSDGLGGSGFDVEIRVPPPNDELRMRGIAYMMYRSLRSSGLAWPLVQPGSAPESRIAPIAHAADNADGAMSALNTGGLNVIERLLQ